MTGMPRIDIGGIELEVDDHGSGDAVVFVHGAGAPDTFLPMTAHPALAGFRRVRYRRRGYGAAGPATRTSVDHHAADCLDLLDALGIGAAHVVGHSYGGCVALQIALTAPERVRCLVLFEPSLLVGPRVEEARTLLQPAGVAYAAGDLEMAVTAMWDVVAGPHWRDFERIVPGFLERAVADAATLFESDLPSLRGWEFGPGQAALVQQPVRYLLGGDTLGLYRDNLVLLRSWLPRLDSVEVPRAHHFLQLEHPEQAAELTAAFLTRSTG